MVSPNLVGGLNKGGDALQKNGGVKGTELSGGDKSGWLQKSPHSDGGGSINNATTNELLSALIKSLNK